VGMYVVGEGKRTITKTFFTQITYHLKGYPTMRSRTCLSPEVVGRRVSRVP
jgi:hypothetical protein